MKLPSRGFRRLAGRGAAVGAASAIAIIAACYPGEVTSIGELDLVATIYDDTFDFRQNATYFLFDSVFHLRDSTNPGDTVSISRQFDQQMLALVRTNMARLGYTVQDPTTGGAQPDVYTAISITASRNYQAYTFYPWWGYPGYPGWPCCLGGPGWGWPTTVVSSYRVGTIFIDIIDTERSIARDTISVIWDAAINGPFEGTVATTTERIDRLFNRAYEQSAYLDVN